MRILIAEDDLISRKFLSKFLSKYGQSDLVVDGMEALDAYMMAMKEKKPYDLICLDIMMPNVDGVKVLKIIRQLEEQNSIASNERCKVIMTTALADTQFVQNAFKIGCDAYAVKPIDTERLVEVMQKLGLLEDSTE